MATTSDPQSEIHETVRSRSYSSVEFQQCQCWPIMLSASARKEKTVLQRAESQCRERFAKIMAVNFVYQSNKAECVGTQTLDGTRL